MKFQIRQSSFLHLLQTVSKAVATRSTKQILSGILLDARDGTLTATAYDLELGIQDSLQSNEENGLTVTSGGSIVLTGRYLLDVVRKLPSDVVHIQVNQNYVTEIQSGSAQFHLHGIDAAEFPKLPVFQGEDALQLSNQLLAELIRTTAFATSTFEVRPILTGIHVQFKNKTLSFTATDALRLATKKVTIESEFDKEWNVVLPGKSLLELVKLLSDAVGAVTVQMSSSHSLFVIGTTMFYTRLIDGTYPDTSRIIPSEHKTEVTVSVDELMDTIERAALIARDRESHQVRLEVSEGNMVFSSSSPEIGNVSEALQTQAKSGPDLKISFNAKYVLEALRAIGDGTVIIYYNGSNQPFVMRKPGDETGLQLISPVLMG